MKMERDNNDRWGGGGEFSDRHQKSGFRRDNARDGGDRPYGQREFGDRPRRGRDFGDNSRGTRDYGERASRSQRDYSDRPRRPREYGDGAYARREYGDRRRPSRDFSDRSCAPRQYGDRSNRPRQYGQSNNRPTNNRFKEERDEMIFGIHAIREAVVAGEEIDFIYVKRDTNSDTMKELLEGIGERRVPIRRVPTEKLDRLTNRNHQGIIAVKAATHYFKLDQVIPTLFEAGREPLIVILDGITDVRNFGAIARTCECTGVDAIVIFEQNSVSVTADAVKTSAGALTRIAVCREKSIEGVIDYLKESGVRLVGASEKATAQLYDVKMSGSLGLIMGAEDTGLSEYSLANCDDLVRIPLFGEIGSLNVSVATGVLLYESVRQKR